MAVRASAARRGILVFHPPRDLPIACGPFFWCPSAIRMDLHAGAVQRHGFNLYLHDLHLLKLLEGAIEHA